VWNIARIVVGGEEVGVEEQNEKSVEDNKYERVERVAGVHHEWNEDVLPCRAVVDGRDGPHERHTKAPNIREEGVHAEVSRLPRRKARNNRTGKTPASHVHTWWHFLPRTRNRDSRPPLFLLEGEKERIKSPKNARSGCEESISCRQLVYRQRYGQQQLAD